MVYIIKHAQETNNGLLTVIKEIIKQHVSRMSFTFKIQSNEKNYFYSNRTIVVFKCFII